MTDLTSAERDELNALRAERDAEVKAAEEPESTLPNTHWLHLANGDVVESKGVTTVHNGIPVIAHYEIPDALQDKPAAEPAHRF